MQISVISVINLTLESKQVSRVRALTSCITNAEEEKTQNTLMLVQFDIFFLQ